MVKVTLDDFNHNCKVDVGVQQHLPPPEVDSDGNVIEKPLLSETEEPDVKVNLKSLEWADEVQVTLDSEGHILRTRDLFERQLEAYYKWLKTPEPPPPPKDPNSYIKGVQLLKEIDRKVIEGFNEITPGGSNKEKYFSEQQIKAYKAWQDTDVYPNYVFLQEEYLESLKPSPPPRDWSTKEYPELLELQNEQFLLWYKANKAHLDNLLKPEVPVEEIPIPPPPPPPPPKDVNIYIKNMEKMKEVEEYWKKHGPYVFWPVKYDPYTYFLELQRYWMSKWEYTEEYLALYRGVGIKKEKKFPWRRLKWWEWKPISNIYTDERGEPGKTSDYGELPEKPLSYEYKEPRMEKPEGESEEGNVTTQVTSVAWDIATKAPYESIAYNTELAEEPTRLPANRIFWDKRPHPVRMDAIYRETYEVIVKTQPNFI